MWSVLTRLLESRLYAICCIDSLSPCEFADEELHARASIILGIDADHPVRKLSDIGIVIFMSSLRWGDSLICSLATPRVDFKVWWTFIGHPIGTISRGPPREWAWYSGSHITAAISPAGRTEGSM